MTSTPAKVHLWTLGAALVLISPRPLMAGEAVEAFRAQTEKWVETRQIISEEKSGWEIDQEYLRSERDLLKEEKKALAAEIEDLEASTGAADEERRELLLLRGEYQRASAVLEKQIRGLEEQVLELAPQLPEPLQDKLKLLLVQIPEDPSEGKTQLGQRLMNVLGVLAQVEKFDGTASFVGETRAVEGGQKVRVRTLYWGLGQAMYADVQGRTAGIGRPSGPDGWEFSNEPELAQRASLLLDIYEGNVDNIEFVQLPVEAR
mgnify:CR=1 FL=1